MYHEGKTCQCLMLLGPSPMKDLWNRTHPSILYCVFIKGFCHCRLSL